jgi:hypothetical protein
LYPRRGASDLCCVTTASVASSNASSWQRIEAAKRGVGPLLLRDGTGPNDPAYVGYQADDGRWMFGDIETKPCYFCQVPPFDSDDGAAV